MFEFQSTNAPSMDGKTSDAWERIPSLGKASQFLAAVTDGAFHAVHINTHPIDTGRIMAATDSSTPLPPPWTGTAASFHLLDETKHDANDGAGSSSVTRHVAAGDADTVTEVHMQALEAMPSSTNGSQHPQTSIAAPHSLAITSTATDPFVRVYEPDPESAGDALFTQVCWFGPTATATATATPLSTTHASIEHPSSSVRSQSHPHRLVAAATDTGLLTVFDADGAFSSSSAGNVQPAADGSRDVDLLAREKLLALHEPVQAHDGNCTGLLCLNINAGADTNAAEDNDSMQDKQPVHLVSAGADGQVIAWRYHQAELKQVQLIHSTSSSYKVLLFNIPH